MTQVRVRLLGGGQAQFDSQTLPFLADKRYQLLAYLAFQSDWVSREHLEYLFWSDRSDKQAELTPVSQTLR